MRVRLAPQAEADLDAIWLYVATESTSVEVAGRLLDSTTGRFRLLTLHPYLGRTREHDLGPAIRSLIVPSYVIIYVVDPDAVSILRVVHGRRDLDALFSG